MDDSSKAALLSGAAVIQMRARSLAERLAALGCLDASAQGFLDVITDQADDMILIVRDEAAGRS